MRSTILTLFLVLFIFKFVSAQNPSFEFNGRVLYSPIQENTTSSSINYSALSPINDSTAIQSFYSATRITTKEYKPELGYEFMANINFPINDKLLIRTGLGINLNRFNVGLKNSTNSTAVLLSSDTIPFVSITSPLSPINYCGSYINNISEISVESDVLHTTINLRIPIEASINLMDSKLRLNLGVYIQTPIVSDRYREYISLERELVDGAYQCEYIKHEETDKSGGNLNNLILGYSVSAEYYINKNLALDIGALRDIGNTFYNAPNTFSNDLENLTVTRYAIGIRYKLSKKEMTE